MVFTRFVEVGRVVLITYGPYTGRYAVIVDIVDQSRALIDGPTSGVPRHAINFRRVQLTDFVVKVPRTAGTKTLLKVVKEFELDSKFASSPFGKKLAVRAKRANMTDFDRFKVSIAKKQRRAIVYKHLKKIKASQ